MITNIEEEAVYYSFAICQVYAVELAEKMPYHIVSVNN